MSKTEVISTQVKDEEVKRADLNVSLSGSAVIAKVVAGSNISLAQTGVDTGTGDVTVNVVSTPNFTKIGVGQTPTYLLDVKSSGTTTKVVNVNASAGGSIFSVDEKADGTASLALNTFTFRESPLTGGNGEKELLLRSDVTNRYGVLQVCPNGTPAVAHRSIFAVFMTDITSDAVNWEEMSFQAYRDGTSSYDPMYEMRSAAGGTGTEHPFNIYAPKIGFRLAKGEVPARDFDFRADGNTNKIIAQFYNPDITTDGLNVQFRIGKADASYQALIIGYKYSTTVGNESGFITLYGDVSTEAGLNYMKGGRFGIGGKDFGGGETVLALTNATVVPTTNPTGGLVSYSEGGRFKVRESGGDIAVLSGIVSIEFVIDGGGSALTTGIKGDLEIPFACTIQQVSMFADQSGSVVVDVWKDTYGNFPPVDADSITASAPPTISSATKSQDSTLTGWTKTIAAGDILRYNIDSITTIQRVVISLKVIKT